MRAGEIGTHNVEVTRPWAGDRGSKCDLNGALGAGREGLAAIVFL